MKSIEMSISDRAMLNRSAGESFPYAEALTVIEVPIKQIKRAIIESEKYGTKLRVTKNGKSTYTHKALISHRHPLCPDIVKSISSLPMLDWMVTDLIVNMEIPVESLPTWSMERKLPDGSYDSGWMTVRVYQRIVGRTYQQRGETDTFTPEASDTEKVGDVRIYFDIDVNSTFVPPQCRLDGRATAVDTAYANAAQRAIEKQAEQHNALKTEVPLISISDEEIELQAAISKYRNTIAEHNKTVDDLKYKVANAKKPETKAAAEKEYSEAMGVLETMKAELEAKEKELDAID